MPYTVKLPPTTPSEAPAESLQAGSPILEKPVIPVMTGDEVPPTGPPSLAWPPLAKLLRPAPAAPRPSAPPTPCPACHEAHFWLSVYGVVVCATCHPPACEAVVRARPTAPHDPEARLA